MSKNAIKHFLRDEFHDPQPDELQKINHWARLLQINCGSIGPSSVHKNLFDVQLNTFEGAWDFFAFLKTQVDPDEICEFIETSKRPQRKPSFSWRTRSSNVIAMPVSESHIPLKSSVSCDTAPMYIEETGDDWRSSPSDLLVKMQDSSIDRDELFDAVLFAEIAKFDEPQTEELVTRLFDFVSEYRLSQEENVKTVVGAAIRKLAMNLQNSQIEQYADLFLPTETDTLPCEIELELAKTILWRLTNSPESLSNEFPKLETCLAELALDYLKPRLILQKNYASVALQAALGVSLLNGEHASRVLKSIKDLEIDWFMDLFRRRLGRLQKQLSEFSGSHTMCVATTLGRFMTEL